MDDAGTTVGRAPDDPTAGARASRPEHAQTPDAPATPTTSVRAPSITVTVVSPEDQLHVSMDVFDMDLSGDQLVGTGPAPAIRISFGPQHTAEEPIDPATIPGTGPVARTTAGASQLVLAVEPPVPFAAATLLDLAGFALVSDPVAGPPHEGLTALEVPQGLIIVPASTDRFITDHQPVSDTAVSALWTARLDGTGDVVAVQAVGSGGDPVPDRSPDAAQRGDIVVQTTQVAPAHARQLWLSLHGAFLDVVGDWTSDPAPGTNLLRWVQRMVSGRDVHVEVTDRGFLTPFGHPAAMVTVTERSFLPDLDGEPVAALVQQTYLTVTESTLHFPRVHMPDDGRRLPFREVTVAPVAWVPVVRQPITWTDDDGGPRSISDENAWHVVDTAGSDVRMAFTAVDDDGNPPVSFELPVSYIEYDNAFGTNPGGTPATALADYYTAAASAHRREVDLGGAGVAWATPVVAGSGLTTKATRRIRFRVDALDRDADGVMRQQLEAAGQPNLFPAVESASVIDEQLGGGQGDPFSPIDVVPHPRWLTDGNTAANLDLAFLSLVEPAVFGVGAEGRAAFAVDLLGEVFNQTTGVATDRDGAAQRGADTTVWDPGEALGEASTALGSILLREIVDSIPFDQAVPGVDIPGVEVTTDDDAIVIRFSFEPKLRSVPAVGFVAYEGARASVVIETRIAIAGGEPSATVDVVLRDVGLQIPPFIPAVELDFARVHVTVPSGGGTDVDVDLESWRFEDLLAWLQPLADILSSIGGPQVSVGDDALDLSFAITPPPLALGVVNIRNIQIRSGVSLPLDRRPAGLDAGVGRPDQPVEITLVGFDGCFHLDLAFGGSPIHLERLSVAAEASVQIYGIDIVVAEAALHLGIGGFFRLVDGAVTFGGSLWLEGVIDVLGIVNVSAALVGSLRYEVEPKELTARGTITYAVDTILTRPKEGSIPLGKVTYALGDDTEVAGARVSRDDTGLSFADRFSRTDWLEYTGAFA